MNGHHNSLGQAIGAPLHMTFPRPRPPATPMTGRFCSVVPTDVANHASALFDAFSADTQGGNWTYLPYGPFDTVEALRDWMQATCTGPDPLFHTILDDNGRPQGLASYLRIEPATAQRLGFHFEGVFRKATHYKGRNRDTAWFSVIDDEWPSLRAAFQRWLSPDNIGADGRQHDRIENLRQSAAGVV